MRAIDVLVAVATALAGAGTSPVRPAGDPEFRLGVGRAAVWVSESRHWGIPGLRSGTLRARRFGSRWGMGLDVDRVGSAVGSETAASVWVGRAVGPRTRVALAGNLDMVAVGDSPWSRVSASWNAGVDVAGPVSLFVSADRFRPGTGADLGVGVLVAAGAATARAGVEVHRLWGASGSGSLELALGARVGVSLGYSDATGSVRAGVRLSSGRLSAGVSVAHHPVLGRSDEAGLRWGR